MTLETKFSSVQIDVEKSGEIEGYASRFGVKDQGGDVVVKGAFEKSLSRRSPIMLWQHDPSRPIGRWTSVKEDEKGLHVKGQINLDVQKGREAVALIADGAISGMSIGYRTLKSDSIKNGRELKELDLWEVSLVTFPMLPEATIESIKSVLDFSPENLSECKKFLEKLLCDAGFSRKQAKHGAYVLAKDVLGWRDAPGTTTDLVEDIRQLVRDL